MKIVVFGPGRRVGALREDKVIDLNRADSGLPARLDSFIEGGKTALDRARRALETARGDAVLQARAAGTVIRPRTLRSPYEFVRFDFRRHSVSTGSSTQESGSARTLRGLRGETLNASTQRANRATWLGRQDGVPP